MYVFIGKEKCNRIDNLKNLLDEKGIQYHYVDTKDLPHNTKTYLKIYCSSYPMILRVKYFSTINETLEHFNKS